MRTPDPNERRGCLLSALNADAVAEPRLDDPCVIWGLDHIRGSGSRKATIRGAFASIGVDGLRACPLNAESGPGRDSLDRPAYARDLGVCRVGHEPTPTLWDAAHHQKAKRCGELAALSTGPVSDVRCRYNPPYSGASLVQVGDKLGARIFTYSMKTRP